AGSFRPATGVVAPAPAAAPAVPAAPDVTPSTDPSAPVDATPPAAQTAQAKPAVTRSRSVATVTARLNLKGAARLRVRALDGKGKRQLVLLAGSRLGTVASRHDAYTISAHFARAGKVTLRLRFARSQLAPGRTFRILVDTMDRRGGAVA